MNKYTAEQVERVHNELLLDAQDEEMPIVCKMLGSYAAVLRERESAKVMVPACSCCGRTDALETKCVDCGEVQTIGAFAPMQASARAPEAELTTLKNLAYDMRQQAGNNNRLTHIGWAQRVERVIAMLAAAPKPEEGE